MSIAGGAIRRARLCFSGSLRVRSAMLLLAILIAPTALHAADVGSVRGVVHDSKHLPIAQAQVTLKSATSEWSQTATTDSGGEFAFISVPIGDYVLTVSQPDFETRSQIVTVTSGFSPVAHVQLAKGPSLPAVTVTAAMDTAVPVTATPTTVVSREDIERTPGAEQTNNLAMITDFVPGAYVVHDQLHVRGGHQTTWAVDGVEIPNTNIASNLDRRSIPRTSIISRSSGAATRRIWEIVPMACSTSCRAPASNATIKAS